MKDFTPWSTEDEERFIQGLGTFSLYGKNTAEHNIELRKKYSQAMTSRSDWDRIDIGRIQKVLSC